MSELRIKDINILVKESFSSDRLEDIILDEVIKVSLSNRDNTAYRLKYSISTDIRRYEQYLLGAGWKTVNEENKSGLRMITPSGIIVILIPSEKEDIISKELEGPILIYDITSLPINTGLTGEQIIEIYKTEKLVLWDSSNGGAQPKIVSTEGEEYPTIKVIDLKNK